MGHQPGDGADSTWAQRGEVLRLDREGGSIRGIACEVFGDRRYRGKVERILRHSHGNGHTEMTADDLDFMAAVQRLSSTDQTRFLIAMHREMLATSTRPNRDYQLTRLDKVEKQIEIRDHVERQNALTRGRPIGLTRLPPAPVPPHTDELPATVQVLLKRWRSRREGTEPPGSGT
jgi:hypothetical protein